MVSKTQQRPIVIKIGGSTLGSNDTTFQDVATLQQRGMPVVIVHGGGAVISSWLSKIGVKATFVRGLRVTDAATLEVVVAVLGGLVNKQIVADLQACGVKAVGISGVDAGIMKGKMLDPELGFVGGVTHVDAQPVLDMLRLGYIPVVAPVALQPAQGASSTWSFLNLNADTAAGELAVGLDAGRLLFLTDVEGILDSAKKLIHRLTPANAKALISSGVVGGGMIPKVEACLTALSSAPNAQIIDGRVPHALLECVSGKAMGTLVERG